MGNRAVITTEDKRIGVYLHWNGGRDSVEAFLAYCKIKKFRPPEQDNYGWARLCQVIANFFGGDLSIGIDEFEKVHYNYLDNGVYIIKNWDIVGREDFDDCEEQQEYDLLDMLGAINISQPENMQVDFEELEKFVDERNK